MTLSGKVCRLQQLAPPVFMPVKSAVSPPAEQNKPLPGEDVELAKEVTSYAGTKNDTKYFNLKVNRNF